MYAFCRTWNAHAFRTWRWLLVDAKCRWRARLWCGKRPRARRHDQQADPQCLGFGRLPLYRSGGCPRRILVNVVPVGDQTVTARSPGYDTATADVVVKKNGAVDAGYIRLVPTIHPEGQATLPPPPTPTPATPSPAPSTSTFSRCRAPLPPRTHLLQRARRLGIAFALAKWTAARSKSYSIERKMSSGISPAARMPVNRQTLRVERFLVKRRSVRDLLDLGGSWSVEVCPQVAMRCSYSPSSRPAISHSCGVSFR